MKEESFSVTIHRADDMSYDDWRLAKERLIAAKIRILIEHALPMVAKGDD